MIRPEQGLRVGGWGIALRHARNPATHAEVIITTFKNPAVQGGCGFSRAAQTRDRGQIHSGNVGAGVRGVFSEGLKEDLEENDPQPCVNMVRSAGEIEWGGVYK